MGNSNGKITAPVSLHADVYPVLGLTKTGTFYDIGHANGNAHGRTNKWSKKKPIRYDTPAELTDAQRTQANHGLAAYEVTGIVNAQGGSAIALPITGTWRYDAPRPGSDWCRLTDWDGYNHKAKIPASGFTDLEIYSDQFSELPTYSFNCKFGNASFEGIGDTTGIEINLNDLTIISGQNITNGKWRLGLAIFIPTGGSSTFTAVVASHEAALGTISSSADIAKYVIDLSLSDRVRTSLLSCFNNNQRSLTAIPCICYNLDYVTSDPVAKYFDFNSGGRAFCMPGGEKISIALKDASEAWEVSISSMSIYYQNISSGPFSINIGGITSLRKPSAAGSMSCQLQAVFALKFTGRHLPEFTAAIPGISGSFINTENNAKYERMVNGSWQEIDATDMNVAGTYRVTATDTYTGSGTRTPVMQVLENLPVYTGASGTSPIVGMQLRFRIAGQTYNKNGGDSTFRMSN